MSVREARMYVGRILMTCGVPSGAVHAVTECILASQSAGYGGFAALLETYSDLRMHAFDRIRLIDVDPCTLEVEAGENHAWILAPTLIDLAVDVARRQGAASLSVRNVRAADELAIVPHLARRHGAIAKVTTDESSASLEVTNGSPPRRPEQWDPLLMGALQVGYLVSESLWRDLHSLSNGALAPDSVVSRRHAGPVILLDDGTVVGRQPSDDDYDPNMLKSVHPTNALAPSNPVQSS
jgi:hypothetical protein